MGLWTWHRRKKRLLGRELMDSGKKGEVGGILPIVKLVRERHARTAKAI